jgi:hypothetical protein
MQTRVNPDPHIEGFAPHPKYSLTAVIDEVSALTAAVRSLNHAGFSHEHISVFIGSEGLAKLDLKGEAHGFLAQFVRAVESLTTEERLNSQKIEEGLKLGKFFIAVRTDGSEPQKKMVRHVLKTHGAHGVRFFGAWTVEHL